MHNELPVIGQDSHLRPIRVIVLLDRPFPPLLLLHNTPHAIAELVQRVWQLNCTVSVISCRPRADDKMTK